MLILRKFRKQMEDLINSSELPIDAIYFVLKDILNEVTQIYENVIREEEQQQAALEEQKKKEKEDTNDEDINKENDAEDSVM